MYRKFVKFSEKLTSKNFYNGFPLVSLTTKVKVAGSQNV